MFSLGRLAAPGNRAQQQNALHKKMAAIIKTDSGIILPVGASSHIWGSAVYLLRKGTLAAKLDLLFGILLT